MNIGNIFKAFARYFVNVFKAFLGTEGAKGLQDAVKGFITTDIGALALDAVEYVHDSLPGLTDVAARDAAKAKLITDAKAAGHDLGILGQAALNLFIELAYQALLAKLAL